MEVKSCRNCGKIYNYLGASTPFCPACMKRLEEKFQQVKQYIKDNPGANISVVAEETECSVKMLKQWVREERLSFSEGSATGIECENCGKTILTGRFCNECKGNLQQSLQKAYQPKKEEAPAPRRDAGAKMRFLE